MTAAQDQLAVFAKQGQDALANALRTWAEAVQRLTTSGLGSSGLRSSGLSSSGLGSSGLGSSGLGSLGLGGPGLDVSGLTLPDLTAAVDQAFDVAEQVLAAQRELTKAVLRAAAASVGGTGRAG